METRKSFPDKKEIRKKHLAIRNAMSEPEKEEKEPEITENETKSTGNITENAENSMTDNKNINKGYKSAITNNLNTLQNLWNSGDPHRIEKMISILDDLHWRLRKVEEIEETENEED